MKQEEQNIVVNHYTNTYKEENRFETFSQKIEYITTMRYIEKYLKKGARILEVGAGTGAYSIALAKMGYNVTALELVPRNVEVMKENGMDQKSCPSWPPRLHSGSETDLSLYSLWSALFRHRSGYFT